jgi:hypothetical protein
MDNLTGIVREYINIMEEAKKAANRSVLDGTISCRRCRALVLESNADGHEAWHASLRTGEAVA